MSNHPKSVINSIINRISIRIHILSANDYILNNHASTYNLALVNSGFNKKIILYYKYII